MIQQVKHKRIHAEINHCIVDREENVVAWGPVSLNIPTPTKKQLKAKEMEVVEW